MPKKPISIEIIQEGDARFLLKGYADGTQERTPIVKLPRKPPWYRYRTVSLDKSRKKGFYSGTTSGAVPIEISLRSASHCGRMAGPGLLKNVTL